jgi:glutathione synthase/RimK-type ligase-like ATP-grasp enzyme
VLKQAFSLNRQQLNRLENRMKKLAITVAPKMDSPKHHFGKLALDLAIDTKRKLWIIEVNNRNLNDELFNFTGQLQVSKQIKLTNLLYTKRLAGFIS